MTASTRVSNKQILDAILGLTQAITATHVAAPAAPAAVPVAPAAPVDTSGIKVGADYMANRKVAAQAHANTTGGEVVLYARRNLRGETKLAFAVAGRFATLKDRGLIGPVASYQPA
jgi:hypothetical protein